MAVHSNSAVGACGMEKGSQCRERMGAVTM